MTCSLSALRVAIAAHVRLIALRLQHGWRAQDPAERYLAAASDHADLERRMRGLERMDCGPSFVTFNH